MIWALIPSWIKIAAGGLLCVSVVAVSSYLVGKRVQRAEMGTETLTKTIEVLQSRNETNVEITSSAAAELCAHFGLPAEQRIECVRRVEQASAEARDSGQDHNGR
jgi:predicted transcriptional regulator